MSIKKPQCAYAYFVLLATIATAYYKYIEAFMSESVSIEKEA